MKKLLPLLSIIWILFFYVKVGVASAADSSFDPIVKLPEYTATGFQYINENGFKANVFLGLPYANAPIGDLRFEKTEPLKLDSKKIINATKFSKACHQLEDGSAMGIISSEDCLYLNVMTPTNPSSKGPLPVLIFIHGGGYGYGFTEIYGYKTFIDNFVSNDIIMVTLQYRLAHFGFLATEDGEINGNFGHLDQLEALKFVKRNIEAFGGDPERITLSGHSVGSLSVHALAMSPKSRGLFNQEIHIACGNYAQWAINNAAVFNHSSLISNAVGCGQADTKERKTCLKNVEFDKFWKVRQELNLAKFSPDEYDILYWTSVYDKDFFGGKSLDQLLPEMAKNSILYGADAGEGLLFSLDSGVYITSVFSVDRGFKPENRKEATPETIKTFLRQLLPDEMFTPDLQDAVINDIFEFYQIGNKNLLAINDFHYWEKLTELYSDIIFKVSMGKEINEKIKYGFKNQYMFLFNYTRPQDRPVIGNLPGHGYFLMYFAGLEIYTSFGISHTSKEKLLQKHFSEMIVNFVKNEIPSSNGIEIPAITSDKFPYMEFNDGVIIDDVDIKPKNDFWEELDKKYGFDFILGKKLEEEVGGAEKSEL